jgi:hypothetical protein
VGAFSDRGMRALAHSGDQQGAGATILLIPEKRLGVAILANTENADADALAQSIVDVVLDR